MITAYEAIIDNGHITWLDTPPNLANQRYKVILLPDTSSVTDEFYDPAKDGEQRWGFMTGKMRVPDDIHWGDEQIAKLFGID